MKTHPSHRTLITAPALAAVLLAIITVLISSSTLAAQDGLQPPTDLAASRDGSSATVTWNHAAAADHYVVAIREAGTKDYTRSRARNTDPYSFSPNPITEKRVSISGLREGQAYRIKVRAVISHGDDIIRSRWTHLHIRPQESQQSAADPSNETPGEGSVSNSARNSFETAVQEGVIFEADGIKFELIPGADFLMAFTSEPAGNRNQWRTPTHDINFSCVGGTSGAEIINRLPKNLTYGDDPNDDPDLGYQLYYGPDDNRQTFDLVPDTVTEVGQSHTRRRHIEPCPADSETDGIVRNDILAWPDHLYTWNVTHSIMERWMLSTNSQGIQWTREPHLDIPLHRNTRKNKGYGLFSDSPDFDPLKHIIWQVHDSGTDADKFMPYRHLTLASIPDQAVDFPTLPNTATQQIADAYLTEEHIYIVELNSLNIHKFHVTRDEDGYFQIGDHVTTIDAANSGTSQTNIRSITGYGKFIFAQFQQQTQAVTYNIDTEEFIPSGFNFQPLLGDHNNPDGRQTIAIATDDGAILYALMPDGSIEYVSSTNTDVDGLEFRFPENSPPSTAVQGALRATAQFPGSVEWTVADTGANEFAKCFDHESAGSLGQTLIFSTKNPTPEGCDHDYEAHIINEVDDTHGYTLEATATDTDTGTSFTTPFNIVLIDQAEPPAPPINLSVETGITTTELGWAPPAAADMAGKPGINGFEAGHTNTGNCADSTEIVQLPETGDSQTFTGIAEGQQRDYCVRALNHEGESDWVSISGTTSRNPAIDGLDLHYNVPENTTPVDSSITIDDADGDAVTVTITGNDAGKFDLTGSGASYQLAFKQAPNYEDHQDTGADGTYEIAVEVSSGAGINAGAAEQNVTVTVTNANDQPQGTPTLTGSVEETATLAAGTSAITDEDRITSPSWEYRWHHGPPSSKSLIPGTGTTNDAYITQGSDADKTIFVEVSYSDDLANRHTVPTNEAGPIVANVPPQIAGPFNFSIGENTTAVATINASDANSQDTPITLSLLDQHDHELFDFDPSAGTMEFTIAPDFERPANDPPSNQYRFTIRAKSGAGAREKLDNQEFSVTVTDDNTEAPDAPDAPTFSGTKQKQTTVSWTKPANAGPEITGYSLEYQLASETSWTSGNITAVTHTGSNPADKTITGLDQHTEYRFRVNATNPEGAGNWSPSSTVTTNENQNPVITPVSDTGIARQVPENTPAGQNIGAPVDADDADVSDGGTFTFHLDGADASNFTIHTNGDKGQVRTKEPLDYETKSSYALTVRVTDGQGGSASKPATITVANTVENPDKPAAPNVTAGTNRSLDVSWTKPSLNGGPEINDYDVEHRQGTSGDWTDLSHNGADTTAEISSLLANTIYQVRVRATNQENGTSNWSLPGQQRTAANTPPTSDEDDGNCGAAIWCATLTLAAPSPPNRDGGGDWHEKIPGSNLTDVDFTFDNKTYEFSNIYSVLSYHYTYLSRFVIRFGQSLPNTTAADGRLGCWTVLKSQRLATANVSGPNETTLNLRPKVPSLC